MEDSCSVNGCENRPGSSSNLEFFRFPFDDSYRLRRWTKFTKRGGNWRPTPESIICSEHFDETKHPKLPVRRKIFTDENSFPESREQTVRRKIFAYENSLLDPTKVTEVGEVVNLTYHRIPLTLTLNARKLKGGGVVVIRKPLEQASHVNIPQESLPSQT